MTDCQAHASWTLKIMHDERDVPQVQSQHQRLQVVDVILKPIRAVLWRSALAESHMIRRNHTCMVCPNGNLVPEQVTLSGLTMEKQN